MMVQFQQLLVNDVQNVDAYVKGRMMLGEAYNFQLGYLFKNNFQLMEDTLI